MYADTVTAKQEYRSDVYALLQRAVYESFHTKKTK